MVVWLFEGTISRAHCLRVNRINMRRSVYRRQVSLGLCASKGTNLGGIYTGMRSMRSSLENVDVPLLPCPRAADAVLSLMF